MLTNCLISVNMQIKPFMLDVSSFVITGQYFSKKVFLQVPILK